MQQPPDLALVVFGASGDLAARKLMPALESLCEHDALPEHFTAHRCGAHRLDRRAFQRPRPRSHEQLHTARRWPEIVSTFRYVAGDYGSPGDVR